MVKKALLSLSVTVLLASAPALAQQVIPQEPLQTPQQAFQQASQQKVTVAYVNTMELLNAFPEREAATQHLITLSQNYKEELELMQSEYNKKYSDYITYQSSLAENIKLRRMQELTELEKKMQQFMDLAQKDIETQEASLLEPLKGQINEAIRQVGIEKGFTVIYDLDCPGIAFVTPDAVDANPFVKEKLGIQ
ncbi:MAG TPA: OmpH family outer membrane protein [Bacteroidales bacterium]|jgi:outer membrane protein|nr:OmpH family outer membrane protein [Bacteroidales bacterium]